MWCLNFPNCESKSRSFLDIDCFNTQGASIAFLDKDFV